MLARDVPRVIVIFLGGLVQRQKANDIPYMVLRAGFEPAVSRGTEVWEGSHLLLSEAPKHAYSSKPVIDDS